MKRATSAMWAAAAFLVAFSIAAPLLTSLLGYLIVLAIIGGIYYGVNNFLSRR